MSYSEKYIKYKTKYENLKNNIDGDNNSIDGNIVLSKFNNQGPKDAYKALFLEYGKPEIILNRPYGIAIWTAPTIGPFISLMLMDESTEHLEPVSHCDFLYAMVHVYISDDILPKVLALSKSIYYDRLKQELNIRCHSMKPIIAVLNLALKIINNPANYQFYLSAYGETIMSTVNQNVYKNLYTEVEQMVKVNQEQYKNISPNLKCTNSAWI